MKRKTRNIHNDQYSYYFPSSVRELVRKVREPGLISESDPQSLFDSYKYVLLLYKQEINGFLKLYHKYETELFLGKCEEARSTIRSIERKYGVSLWLISQKLVVSQLISDSSFKKEVVNLRNSFGDEDSRPFINYLFLCFSEIASRTFTYSSEKQLQEELKKKRFSEEQKTYLKYKAGFDFRIYRKEEGVLQKAKYVLFIEESLSIIDLFLTCVDVLCLLFAEKKYRSDLMTIVCQLYPEIEDFRLRNLFTVFQSSASQETPPEQVSVCLEAYMRGDYNSLESILKREGIQDWYGFDHITLFLKSGIKLKNYFSKYQDLWDELYKVYQMKNDEKTPGIVWRYYKLFYHTSLRYKIYRLLARKLQVEDQADTLCYSVLSDLYPNPLFAQLISHPEKRIRFLTSLKSIYPVSCALLEYMQTGKGEILEELRKDPGIDPCRLSYYRMLGSIRTGASDIAISEGEALLKAYSVRTGRDTEYHQERLIRILVRLYVQKKTGRTHFTNMLMLSSLTGTTSTDSM